MLQVPVENAPPAVLRALADGLRQDSRVTATVPPKVIGDIGVALRAYAGFLDARPDMNAGRSGLDAKTVINELQILGFAIDRPATIGPVRLALRDLVVYVRKSSPEPLVIHPIFESYHAALSVGPHGPINDGIRFSDDPAFVDFPQRQDGGEATHYGIPFGFSDTTALRQFVGALQDAATAPNLAEPDRTVADEISAPDTDASALVKARRGQGRFRLNLLRMWQGRCVLTGVTRPECKRRRRGTVMLTLPRVSLGCTVFRRPVPWQQSFQCIPLGATRDDAFQHIGEPGQRLDVVQLRGLDQ